MRREIDEGIAKLAANQANAFHRDQAYDLGGDKKLAARRESAGLWIPAARDVFTLPGAVSDPWRQRLWIGHLASEGVVSFESAGQAYKLDGVRHGLAILTVSHSDYHRIEGVVVHQITDVLPHHVTAWEGLPITTPARTIIDLASVLTWSRLRAAIESAILQRLTTVAEIEALRLEVTRRGKPGMRQLRRMLDALDGQPPAASILERWLLDTAAMAGIRVVRQHPVPWTREPILGLTDATALDAMVIFEADGRRWHARYQAMARDRRRDVEAAKAGYQTLRFVHEDSKNDQRAAARDMRIVYDQRMALLHGHSRR